MKTSKFWISYCYSCYHRN